MDFNLFFYNLKKKLTYIIGDYHGCPVEVPDDYYKTLTILKSTLGSMSAPLDSFIYLWDITTQATGVEVQDANCGAPERMSLNSWRYRV